MDQARNVTAQFVDTVTITVELHRPVVEKCFSGNVFYVVEVPCGSPGASTPQSLTVGTDYVRVDPTDGYGLANCGEYYGDICHYTFDAPIDFFDLTLVQTDDGYTIGGWTGCEVLSVGACELSAESADTTIGVTFVPQ